MFSRKPIATAVLLLCLVMTGCAGGDALGSPPPGPESEPPGEDGAGPGGVVPPPGGTMPAAGSNIVDLDLVHPGDRIAGLVVETIEPFGPLGATSANNVRIVFSGAATIDGEFTYHGADGMYPDQVTFQLAEQSRGAVPMTRPDDKTFLLFSNQDFAQEQFGPPGSHGQATVIISDYVLERYPSSVASNRAVLVEVLEVRPGVLPEPKG